MSLREVGCELDGARAAWLANALGEPLLRMVEYAPAEPVPPFRRYGGIIIDLAFDHVLARDWSNYEPGSIAAFDEEGNPTKPAQGFARSCGVAVAELDELETDKGSFLAYRTVQTGKPAGELIPGLVEQALRALPG